MPSVFFVHPGFLRRRDADACLPEYVAEVQVDVRYGDYQEYLNNLQRLYRKVGRQGIFLVERKGKELNPYHTGFEPLPGSLVLEYDKKTDRIAVLRQEGVHWVPVSLAR